MLEYMLSLTDEGQWNTRLRLCVENKEKEGDFGKAVVDTTIHRLNESKQSINA
jgi:hypothetical protein